MCAGAKCAYRRTIAADFQSPISCRSYKGMPFWISQLAEVCRRSCQRNSAIPARLRAFRQAFVFTYLTGLPSYVKTRSGCETGLEKAGRKATSCSCNPPLARGRSGRLPTGAAVGQVPLRQRSWQSFALAVSGFSPLASPPFNRSERTTVRKTLDMAQRNVLILANCSLATSE